MVIITLLKFNTLKHVNIKTETKEKNTKNSLYLINTTILVQPTFDRYYIWKAVLKIGKLTFEPIVRPQQAILISQ